MALKHVYSITNTIPQNQYWIGKNHPDKLNSSKKMCSVFAKHKFGITIETNKKIVNFLDVTLTHGNGAYRPFMKHNNIPLYDHSNNTRVLLNNIAESVNTRPSDIMANEDALKKHPMITRSYCTRVDTSTSSNTYQKIQTPSKRNRNRNSTWFNPPLVIMYKQI